MPGLPSGTVTFLFTDIEGSTRLLQEHGPGYADLLEEHERIVRYALAANRGVEVEATCCEHALSATRAEADRRDLTV